ncbi:MAG TPA: (d)CMP kinase [Alcanivoracaceae bacterium]|nr:(d)CMP kinase [Alcanivoracaceae bacterium]
MSTIPVITIDGPVSSGKGTIASALATQLHWHLLDSGAIYRVLGLYAQQQGVALDDAEALLPLAENLPVEFKQNAQGGVDVWLAEQEVSNTIREEKVGELASQVAVLPTVRQALLKRQQDFAQTPGLVADGRDMGTVVFPQAPLKIFLTASAEERARRRFQQLQEKGFPANLEALIEEIRARDERDMGRSVAPLKPAEDAVVIDSTEMGIEEVVNTILEHANSRGLRPA